MTPDGLTIIHTTLLLHPFYQPTPLFADHPLSPSSNMASLLPPTFVPVTHFGSSDQDLASDEEWDSEIEEEVVTISLDQALDTSILASPPSFSSNHVASSAGPSTQFSHARNGQAESTSVRSTTNDPNSSSSRRTENSPQSEAELARSHTWSLIGLNTPTPFLKVNNTLFKGKLMERIGNEMIFGNPSTSSSSSSSLFSASSVLGSSTNLILPSLQTIQFTPQTYNPTGPTDGPSASSSYPSFAHRKKPGLSGGRPRDRPAGSERTRSDLSGLPGGVEGTERDGEDDLDEGEEDDLMSDEEDMAAEEDDSASENERPNVYSEDEIPVERPLPSEQTRTERDDRSLAGWQVVNPKRSAAASASTSGNGRKSRSKPLTSNTIDDRRSSPSVSDQPIDPLGPNPLEGNVLLEDRQIEIGDGEAVQGFTSLIDTLSHNHDSSSQLPEWSPYVSEQNERPLGGLLIHPNESANRPDSEMRGMIDPSLVDPSLRADTLTNQPQSDHIDAQQGRGPLIDPSLLNQDIENSHQPTEYAEGQQEAYPMTVDGEQSLEGEQLVEGEANVGERLQRMHWDSD